MKRLTVQMAAAFVLFVFVPSLAKANPTYQMFGGAHWEPNVGTPNKDGTASPGLVMPKGSMVLIGNIRGINTSALSLLGWEGKNDTTGAWTSTSPRWDVYMADAYQQYTAILPHWASTYAAGSSIDFTSMTFNNVSAALSWSMGMSTAQIAKLSVQSVALRYDGPTKVVLDNIAITVNGQKWIWSGP